MLARPLRTQFQMQTFIGKWEVAMRGIAFCTVTAAIGATVFASASARAVPIAGLNSAKAIPAQEVKYTCRGSHQHRCYYVNVARSSGRYPGYYPYTKGVWGNMYRGQDEYNVHYWGSGVNSEH